LSFRVVEYQHFEHKEKQSALARYHQRNGVARSPAQTRYANSGGVHIAYQVVGDGPLDLIFVPGWVSHVEHHWEEPRLAYFLHRLARFSRLIVLDKRGTGLSDRVAQIPDLEQRMDDVRAVQDAAGSERAALFGYSEGGSMCQLFAATYPSRTHALITYGCWAKRLRSQDYPWGRTLEERQHFYDFVVTRWGGIVDLADLAPSVANDPEFCEWFATYLRRSASPGAALALAQMNTHIDLRPVLPTIQVPTLIIHRTGDRDARIEEGRFLAANIPGAQFLELPGVDHLPWVGDADAILDAIEGFLSQLNLLHAPAPSLATVLSVRISPTCSQIQSETLTQCYAAMREVIARHAGDARQGVALLATFSSALQAIRSALQLQQLARTHGYVAHVGIHLGDCRRTDQGRRPATFDIAESICELAQASQIMVSRDVKNLITGSGIPFVDPPAAIAAGVEGIELFLVDPKMPADQRSAPVPDAQALGARRVALTRQQRTVLEFVAQGLSNKEIARLMKISEHTVHRHMANIFDRLGVFTRAAAVARGLMPIG
jgi:pimeloyl-ACP methyl ester carboxylesterase/DNA-binding CsgD family transcriptional regulator